MKEEVRVQIRNTHDIKKATEEARSIEKDIQKKHKEDNEMRRNIKEREGRGDRYK